MCNLFRVNATKTHHQPYVCVCVRAYVCGKPFQHWVWRWQSKTTTTVYWTANKMKCARVDFNAAVLWLLLQLLHNRCSSSFAGCCCRACSLLTASKWSLFDVYHEMKATSRFEQVEHCMIISCRNVGKPHLGSGTALGNVWGKNEFELV